MFPRSLGLLSLAALAYASSQSVQWDLVRPATNTYLEFPHAAPYDDGLFTPVRNLNALSVDSFTTLRHSSFPKYSVRVKRTPFECDPTSIAYTGYIDVEAKHLFYYFFESRNDPATDDVIMWINGVYNPYSWTTNASVFYVDQPIGVGYSYADYAEHVSTTEEAAKDIAAFIAVFFEHFSPFKGRAFHMAGESYGVYDQNAKLVAGGRTAVNLKLVMIGNVYECICIASHFEHQHVPADETCATAVLKVEPSIELSGPVLQSGLNPYDVSKKCEGPESVHCYPVMQHMVNYLALESTRKLLGVSPAVPGFSACNTSIADVFDANLDLYHETYTHVAQLLQRGVRTLVYIGTYDWIYNWIGNKRWTVEMPWTGQEVFVSNRLTDWFVDGKAVGKMRSANGLTYATVNEAGHMVPYDKPKEALVLVQRWLAEQPL